MERNNLFSKIYTAIEQNQLIKPGDTLIIGLSGGPDSLFLLHYLASIRTQFNLALIAAHLDHGWRPESAEDVKFCQEACDALGVLLVTQKFSDLGISLKFNGSLEDVGRQARRHFFQSIKEQYQAQAIVLGHHLQDQQETFFIRLIRGTSLSGLVSMRPRHGDFIRPLLSICKDDMVAYLKDNAIPYLEDPTNNSSNFLRNRIRQHVLPALKACDDRFEGSFNATITRLQALETYLEKETALIFESLELCKFGKKGLNLKSLLRLPPIMQERLIVTWLCQEQVTFPVREQFLQEIIKFLQNPRGGMHAIHHEWAIGKKSDLTWIEKNESTKKLD
jgi:tRNA(Ile)-lysidine synthase